MFPCLADSTYSFLFHGNLYTSPQWRMPNPWNDMGARAFTVLIGTLRRNMVQILLLLIWQHFTVQDESKTAPQSCCFTFLLLPWSCCTTCCLAEFPHLLQLCCCLKSPLSLLLCHLLFHTLLLDLYCPFYEGTMSFFLPVVFPHPVQHLQNKDIYIGQDLCIYHRETHKRKSGCI